MNEQQLIQLEIAARRSSIERSLLEEARIQREYASMLHNVRRDIESFYGRYAIDEGVSISEARRRASATDINSTMDRIERLCDAGLGDRAMQEVRLLELTMTVNRLENLRANIGLSVLEGYDRLERQYGAMLTERTADEIERRAHELGLRQAHLNYDQIVKNPMGQANYLDRLWANQEYFRSDIEKALKQAMIGGKSLDELAKDIQKKFGGAEYQAKRLLRTEVKRVETEAFKELMLENGIKYYKYATVDSNACAECKHMNGRRYKVENLEAGVNAPPLHPNCRCSTIPWGTGWYKWNKGNNKVSEDMRATERLIGKRKDVEQSVVYDKDMNRIMSKTGKFGEVVFTDKEVEKMKGCTLTHNHPNGTSLSPDDINLLRLAQLAEIRATTDDGTTFFMKQPKVWPKEIDTLEKIEAERKKFNEIAENKAAELIIEGKLERKDALRYTSYESNRLFADKYGIEYGSEKA